MERILTPAEFAPILIRILGSQNAVAEALGVSQSNVSKWLNDPGAETLDPVRVLAGRLLEEYRVRISWISAFLRAGIKGEGLSLVRKEELVNEVEYDRVLVDRNVDVFEGREEAPIHLVVVAFAEALTKEFLSWGFLASGDFFGFYREEEDGRLRVVSFTVNDGRKPKSSIRGSIGDPIFGG